MSTTDHDPAASALRRIDRARGAVLGWIAAAAVLEGCLVVAILLLADFQDRVHVLLLLSSLLVYGTLGMGLAALGAYMRWCMLRVVDAIDLWQRSAPGEGGGVDQGASDSKERGQ